VQHDLIVVGGGIIGLATARELLTRRPGLRLAVLEKEQQLGSHQTSHNSGVIHAGVYYPPGSLKARLCVAGARALYAYCEEKGIPAERCGKLVIALSADELPALDELERRARTNGVEGLRRIDGGEIQEIEPHAAGIAALHVASSGIVDFAAVARALAEEVTAMGASVLTGTEVRAARPASDHLRVTLRDGELAARHAVFCAGLWSDRLAMAAGASPEPRIVPFRGAYLKLAPERRSLCRGLIYPVPDPRLPFLGVHVTRRVDGEVLLGPTALMVGARDAYSLARLRAGDLAATLGWPGTWRLMARFWRTGITEIRHAAGRRAFHAACARYMPELRREDLRRGPAGVGGAARGRAVAGGLRACPRDRL
jgi:L-2-hydroxyglutarate oxidase